MTHGVCHTTKCLGPTGMKDETSCPQQAVFCLTVAQSNLTLGPTSNEQRKEAGRSCLTFHPIQSTDLSPTGKCRILTTSFNPPRIPRCLLSASAPSPCLSPNHSTSCLSSSSLSSLTAYCPFSLVSWAPFFLPHTRFPNEHGP